MRNDLSAIIVFRELHLDKRSNEVAADKGLEFLAELSMQFTPTDSSSVINTPHQFKLGKEEFCSYELKTGSMMKRVVVFQVQNRTFECEASPVNGAGNQTTQTQLFTIQQSVLASLQFSSQLP
jgi:plasmid replication initiation protein